MAQDEFAKLMALSSGKPFPEKTDSADATDASTEPTEPLVTPSLPSLSIDPMSGQTKRDGEAALPPAVTTPLAATPAAAQASDLPPLPAPPAAMPALPGTSSAPASLMAAVTMAAPAPGPVPSPTSGPTSGPSMSTLPTLSSDAKPSEAARSAAAPTVSAGASKPDSKITDGARAPLSTREAAPSGVAPSATKTDNALPGGPSLLGSLALAAPVPSPASPVPSEANADPATVEPPPRRIARRRPAGPVRGKIAANDDVPSIGGLIYALEQKPSARVFRIAAIASAVWAVVGITFASLTLFPKLSDGASFGAILADPVLFYTAAAVLVPIAIFWLLALLNWHIASLSLKSSTMTEVAIRLAEPDRNAEQSIASLGQAVRRQVSFMNDAVSRALGRAGELEALVHNQVADLERSYEQNEQRIRGLIQELTGERHALLNTSNGVTDTLKTLGTEIPALIEKLSTQQETLSKIIKGAGENLATLEGSLAQSTGRFESVLGDRTMQLQTVLEDYTSAFSTALESRTEHMRSAFDQYMLTLDDTLGNRTGDLQTVFEEYARALDTTLSNRADALDTQLVARTQSLDDAFQRRLEVFEEQISNSTAVIDNAVSEKANLLTTALEAHAISFRESMERQATDLDESVMNGINAVRRSSENITLQTMRAIEGLSQQSNSLQTVSENLFRRIEGVTDRFETQNSKVLHAASMLEDTNSRIDTTLQSRHEQLARTLEKLSGKADAFERTIADYSTGIEGSLSTMEEKARLLTHELRDGAEVRSRALIDDLERLKAQTEAEGQRKLEEMRHRFTNVSGDLSKEFTTLTSRLKSASDETRQRAAEAAEQLAREQIRIRDEAARLPASTRETAEAMRRALQDQMRALDQLTQLSARTNASRDVTLPGHLAPPVARNAVPDSYGFAASQQPATPARGASTQASGRDAWSLGDLLARASNDERDEHNAGKHTTADVNTAAPFRLDIAMISRAIDPATAANIWGRLRSGQRGVMVRSLYGPDARALFDTLQQRLATDGELRQTVSRYIADFERILDESDAQDASGRTAHSNIVSDTGRVFLFLAHAANRI